MRRNQPSDERLREEPRRRDAARAEGAERKRGSTRAQRVVGTRIRTRRDESVVAVLLGGVAARAHLVAELLGGTAQDACHVGELLDELGLAATGTQPGHVLPDENLRVAVGAGADADRRDVQLRR